MSATHQGNIHVHNSGSKTSINIKVILSAKFIFLHYISYIFFDIVFARITIRYKVKKGTHL